MNTESFNPFNRWSILTIFLISVVVIALQLVLMRAISVTHYYHFTYLVISTALLGFGTSGTFLALYFEKLKQNFPFWNLLFLLLFIVSIPAAYLGAQALPLDTQYVLYSGYQLLILFTYNIFILIPFFFGGLVITFMLAYFKKEVPTLYAANLAGSGVGGLAAILLMTLIPAYRLPLLMAPLALTALITFFLSTGRSLPFKSGRSGSSPAKPAESLSEKTDSPRHLPYSRPRSFWAMLALGTVFGISTLFIDIPDRVDPYKELSSFRQLELQGDAEQIVSRFGPRAQIDVFESPTFHYTLFAGPHSTAMPPPQLAILLDGSIAAPLFLIDDAADAEVLDFTPQSLPYRLLDSPHVLLLGEIGGINVWLAKRMGAEKITVVQNNPQLIRLLREDLAEASGTLYEFDEVDVVNQDPRLFMEQTSEEQFDLIHIVTGEAAAAGTGGLQGLNEDYMLTTESFRRALELLTPQGLVSITRGIQTPVRDNLKISSLIIDAAQQAEIRNPGDHMLISRNYLAVNSLFSAAPVTSSRVEQFLEEAQRLQLDLEHYPGIRSDEIDQLNRIDGPENANYSWIHRGITQLLSDDPDSFYRNWVYNVRAPTDDSPYFHDFFKWSSLDRFVEAYGDQWFQRLELGYVVLVITFLQLALIAFLLIILPLIFRRNLYSASLNKMPTLLHFFMIGTGFMFIEITLIQTFTKFLGDPIFSAAAVICSILIFSGLGSMTQKYLQLPPTVRIRIAVCGIALFTLLFLALADPLLDQFIGYGTFSRFTVAILTLFPISYFLGWMLPCGIRILEKNSDELIPWALAIDSFASVSAAPLAIILSMSIGFSNVILLGLGCYLAAGLTSWLWRVKI